jgi:polysaccharide pyruvyl transferase WcaK-like protein
VIHHVFANRSNAGDWLSAQGIQSLLTGLQITEHLCDQPFVDATLSRLSVAGPGDLVVIGGGGLFMDYFDSFWRGLNELSERVRFGLWGLGVVDLKLEDSRLDNSLQQRIVEKAAFCSLRDERSRQQLESSVSLPGPVVCPSVLALAPAAEQGWGVLHVDNLTTVGESAYEHMDQVAWRFAADTGRPYRRTNNLHRESDHRDLARVLDLYTASDVVVTSRLHGCIIGAAMGRRVVAVSGDWKIESFMKAVGLHEWVLPQEAVDVLPEVLRRIDEQPDPATYLDAARRAHRQTAVRVRALASDPRRGN